MKMIPRTLSRRPRCSSRMAFGLLGATILLLTAGMAGPLADEGAAARVGQRAPDFSLQDTAGHTHQLSDYLQQGKTVVLEWFNPDCPFVKRHHERLNTMKQLHETYHQQDVVWLAINSGAPGKQGHGKQRNAAARKQFGIDYPVLLDESGQVGRLYGAKTTPHMFIVKSDGMLVYAGGIDDDPRGSKSGRINYVAQALKAHLDGSKIQPAETESYGCSVKYGSADGKAASKAASRDASKRSRKVSM